MFLLNTIEQKQTSFFDFENYASCKPKTTITNVFVVKLVHLLIVLLLLIINLSLEIVTLSVDEPP